MSKEFAGFKSQFGHNIFRSKYANHPQQTWAEKAALIVRDVCNHPTRGQLLPSSCQKQLVQYIKDFKFMPGGRYIYYAGRAARFWNNCFGAETRVLTDGGWRKVSELGQANVLSPIDGAYYPAEFVSRGKQRLNKITFANVRGVQSHSVEVRATRNHHWALKDGTDTYDIRVGDVVPANIWGAKHDDLGFAHGFVFGDGNEKGQLRLCADKDKKYLSVLAGANPTVTYPPFAKGDPCLYFKQDVKWKSVPEPNASPEYIASFIRGWLQADGSEKAGCKLCSINKEALEWFRDHAAYAGVTVTGELRFQDRDVTIGKYEYPNHRIYIQSYSYGGDFPGYKVVSIEDDGEEEVFCPYEPIHNRIVIDHNIHTFNCYLLRGEEDTREEWAALAQRTMSCLTTGGGIGIDYSIFRPEGSYLGRTGGKASGPIPLMHAINEIGRNVMQGGSRRSAIYGSLNWQHPDARRFLTAKDWGDMMIGPSYSHWDAKQWNFNHQAPLDMTNISLNYDDAWQFNPKHETFLQNVRQALMTGEPGFSFNFGDKQNETLRNACTEVVSEDDSDVCNLGSVNMGCVDSLEEFENICNDAAAFLLCGTLGAELPYQKVYDVREKNRRLGLGLMGVHEWFLRRGKKYDSSDEEFQRWMRSYKIASEEGANWLAYRLGVNKPVAYRAIAPTGTIGILAGPTTTGIEPLFAVAYKRRYLMNGTEWKYEYVIDNTAKRMIDEYGVRPDDIETAVDLAYNPERRIKFQADVQDYVDMAISSTINLPAWGTGVNTDDNVTEFAELLAKYSPRLRGFTCYPDGARGGQPLTSVPYSEALGKEGVVYDDNDSCKGGVCGI